MTKTSLFNQFQLGEFLSEQYFPSPKELLSRSTGGKLLSFGCLLLLLKVTSVVSDFV